MAHRVLVMSPLHNSGATVASILIAQGMTYFGKPTMLTFTDPHSNLPSYMGIQANNDPTRSISQIVRLIDTGSLDDKDITNYAFDYAKNAYMMNVADSTLEKADRTQIVRHVFKRTPTDVNVIDYSDDVLDTEERLLFEDTDQIFLVINPSKKYYNRLKIWVESPVLKNFENVYIIINMYNEVVASVRQIAKFIGFPSNKVCQIHYNPWITFCCLKGELHTILPNSWELDPRVSNLRQDIVEIAQAINGCSIMQTKRT